MIRKSVANAVLPIADTLMEKGLVVTPTSGSTLAELVKWSHGMVQTDTASLEDRELELVLENSNTDVMEGMSGHSAALDIETENTVKIITAQLKYIKEIAKPLLDNTFREIVSSYEEGEGVKVDVIPFEISELYRSQAFNQLIEVYQNLDIKAIKCKVIEGWPERDESELFKVIATGALTFDEAVNNIINRYDSGWLVEVYRRHFVNADWSDTVYSAELQASVNQYSPDPERLDEYLMVYLISMGIRDDVHEGYGHSLSAYRASMAAKCRASAAAMFLIVKGYIRREASGNMVIRYNTVKSDRYESEAGVVVSAPAYKKYLDLGGSPEAVMGAALLDANRPITVDSFIERSVELVAKYNATVRRNATMRENYKIERYSEDSKWWFYGFTSNSKKLDVPSMTNYDSSNQSEWCALVDKAFSAILPKRWATEPYIVLRELFGVLLWRDTNVMEVLTSIDEESNLHPDIDVREAAYRAVMRYVTKYYLTQVEVLDAETESV